MTITEQDIEKLTTNTIGGLRIEKVEEQPANFNLLIYGDSGVGKTRLAGSASVVPELSPVLFIDTEGGTMTLRDSYPETDVVRVKTWEDMQKVYDELYRGNSGYRTIVLDSLTEVQKLGMYSIMEQLVKMGRNSGEPVDPDVPGMREWGKNLEVTRKLVRAFRDLKLNTIFTALSMDDKDAKTGVVKIKPSLNGKAKTEVPAFLDIVMYMYMKAKDDTQTRILLTQSTEKVAAKDRSNKLPQTIEQPTMQKLYELMYGKGNNES